MAALLKVVHGFDNRAIGENIEKVQVHMSSPLTGIKEQLLTLCHYPKRQKEGRYLEIRG